MSSEYEGDEEQQPEDAYTRMWENVDEDWLFDPVEPVHWSVWDEPPEADRSLNDFGPYSSSTLEEATPPRNPRNLNGGPVHSSQGSAAHDTLTAPSLAPTRDTASSSRDPRLQQHSQASRTAAAESARRRVPAADYSEDWLEHGAAGRQSSFGYIPDHIFETLSEERSSPHSPAQSAPLETPRSPLETPRSPLNEEDMAPMTRRRTQARPRGSIVDLTADPSSPREQEQLRPRSLKRAAEEAAEQSRVPKRSKPAVPDNVEELDLTNEAPSAEEELLQQQQQEAIKSQQSGEDNGPVKIGQRQCIICMEPYTNATITVCGHIYCHECLTQALMAGEKNSDRGVGNCPVCRKPVNRKKAGQMIPINFLKKNAFKTKGRKVDAVG